MKIAFRAPPGTTKLKQLARKGISETITLLGLYTLQSLVICLSNLILEIVNLTESCSVFDFYLLNVNKK